MYIFKVEVELNEKISLLLKKNQDTISMLNELELEMDLVIKSSDYILSNNLGWILLLGLFGLEILHIYKYKKFSPIAQ